MKGVLWCARRSEAKDGVHIKGTGLRLSAMLQRWDGTCLLRETLDQFVSPEEKLGLLWRPAAIT